MSRKPYALKRPLDVTLASLGLALSTPLWLAAALGTYATLGRPVLFKQPRAGLDGRVFSLIKFRSMRTAVAGQSELGSESQRLTRLGALLRKTSVDELPTLLNVLKGEMSLVGPRPLLVAYLPRYSALQRRRHEVLPGVTGWAQVNGRNALSWEAKFELDVWYVEHQSLRLDLLILWRTLSAVLGAAGVSAQGHAAMPEFLGSKTLDPTRT